MAIKKKKEGKKRTPFIIGLSVFIIFAACCLYFILCGGAGFSADAGLTLISNAGKLELSWDKPDNKKNVEYIVEIYDGSQDKNTEPLYSAVLPSKDLIGGTGDCMLTLPEEIKPEQQLTFYVNTIRFASVLGKNLGRRGKKPLTADYKAADAGNYIVDYSIDTENSEITFSFKAGCPGTYQLYLKKEDGSRELLTGSSEENGEVSYKESFGENGFAIPAEDEEYTFFVACQDNTDRMIINYESIFLDREDFLTDKPVVSTEDDGKNRYIFSWNEAKGDGYKVSLWDEEKNTWQNLAAYSRSDDRVFETGRLNPCADYRYKVEATGTLEDVGETDRATELDLHTSPCTEYAAVWPTQDLPVYKDSTGEEQVGTISVLQSVSVLDEQDGRFFIRLGADDDSLQGYIDSNKCMINLPDYIGDLCKYDITNSYSSIYLAHNYGIPAVSGTVVSGYEHVLLSDGTFLVPLLYPVAKKLVPAAEDARQKGYIIKIYDSFRPYVATRSIYDLTAAALNYAVPDYDFTRISLRDYENGKRANVISLSQLKKVEPVTEETTEQSKKDKKNKKKNKKEDKKEKKKEETTEAPEIPKETTYADVMLNNGAYSLGAFLAAKGSMHNLGVAMDMTIELAETGEELVMQSNMHDLSYYSIQSRNNENANILKDIMTPQGFSMITSEWWHFQDNDVRDTLNPASVQNGVSIEGWKKDEGGWKYRTVDGNYYRNTSEKIGDKTYSFDADGYVK